MRNLIIGGLEIPIRASHDLSQTYKPLKAVARTRMADGTLRQQESWTGKLRTTITARGIMFPGINELNYSQSVTIKCVAERTVLSASNVITVPSNRRADYGVEGRAFIDDQFVSTPVSLVDDEATLTVVAGATQYQAIYWPELICFLDPSDEDRDARKSIYNWSLEAEEI